MGLLVGLRSMIFQTFRRYLVSVVLCMSSVIGFSRDRKEPDVFGENIGVVRKLLVSPKYLFNS